MLFINQQVRTNHRLLNPNKTSDVGDTDKKIVTVILGGGVINLYFSV